MRRRTASTCLAFAIGLLIVAGFAGIADAHTEGATAVDRLIANWPEKSRQVANTVIGKYGQPDEATASMLIWHDNGPWKRTILYRDPVQHDFPMPHLDVLEQFVDYRVPPEKFDDLAMYDGSVIAERTKGEMSARCDKEGANLLALNLAHDIIRGTKTVEQAREAYADAIMAMMRGEKPAAMQGLQFQTMARAADPGVTVIPQTMISAAQAEQEARTNVTRETRTTMRKE